MTAALAKIHIAKKDLALDDETYRDLLERETGKRSAGAMTAAEHEAVLAAMMRAGWSPHRRPASGAQRYRQASGKGYVRKLFALWRSVHQLGGVEDGSAAALKSFVAKRSGVADPEWLTYAEASPLIEALKEMEARVRTGRAHASDGGEREA